MTPNDIAGLIFWGMVAVIFLALIGNWLTTEDQ